MPVKYINPEIWCVCGNIPRAVTKHIQRFSNREEWFASSVLMLSLLLGRSRAVLLFFSRSLCRANPYMDGSQNGILLSACHTFFSLSFFVFSFYFIHNYDFFFLFYVSVALFSLALLIFCFYGVCLLFTFSLLPSLKICIMPSPLLYLYLYFFLHSFSFLFSHWLFIFLLLLISLSVSLPFSSYSLSFRVCFISIIIYFASQAVHYRFLYKIASIIYSLFFYHSLPLYII